jgi:hypothetical protein
VSSRRAGRGGISQRAEHRTVVRSVSNTVTMAALMGFTAVSGLAARNASVSGSRIVAMPTTTSQPVRSFNVEAAHKKGTGSTKNGRDSNPQYLGVKKYGGEQVTTGNIIIRQRGNKVRDRDVAWDPSDPPAKTLKPCESCPFYPPRP